MCFLSYAVVLGVGYWIGKRQTSCFKYKIKEIQEVQNEPNSAEYVLRVERKDWGPHWGHSWWSHHHCHKTPELVEVEKNK